MKWNIFYLLSAITLLLLLPSACNTQKTQAKCSYYAKAPVTGIEGPNTASINQDISLAISFICANGCGQFGNFKIDTSGSTLLVTVNARYEGCVCTENLPTRITTFKFKKTKSGTYEVKFMQKENTYLTHTVIVQ